MRVLPVNVSCSNHIFQKFPVILGIFISGCMFVSCVSTGEHLSRAAGRAAWGLYRFTFCMPGKVLQCRASACFLQPLLPVAPENLEDVPADLTNPPTAGVRDAVLKAEQ